MAQNEGKHGQVAFEPEGRKRREKEGERKKERGRRQVEKKKKERLPFSILARAFSQPRGLTPPPAASEECIRWAAKVIDLWPVALCSRPPSTGQSLA